MDIKKNKKNNNNMKLVKFHEKNPMIWRFYENN